MVSFLIYHVIVYDNFINKYLIVFAIKGLNHVIKICLLRKHAYVFKIKLALSNLDTVGGVVVIMALVRMALR